MINLSTDAINKDFKTSWYHDWMVRQGLEGSIDHSKFWEQAMLYTALKQEGVLKEGKHGIGFGVGQETLVSAFASDGAHITATDQPPEDTALAWDNGQLAKGKATLFYEEIVDKKTFEANVQYEPHDMNKFSKSYVNKFDFAWSDCVIGHLGSMDLSVKHLLRHAKYLKYGGVSVLTTELNISSLTDTITKNSGTIIWRLSDLYKLFEDMLEEDMVAARFQLRLASDTSDHYIYYDKDDIILKTFFKGGYKRKDNPAKITKIPFSNFAITPIQIIFRKQHLSPTRKKLLRQRYRMELKRNTAKLRKYIHSHGDITDYSTTYDTHQLSVTPKQQTIRVNVKPGEVKQAKVAFTNDTKKALFSYGLHTPFGVPPLVLATDNPTNRSSKLQTKAWFSDNRPSVAFTPTYKKSDFRDHCHGEHRSLPGETLTYTFDVKAPKKKGTYNEDFCLVLEGVGSIPNTAVKLQIVVD